MKRFGVMLDMSRNAVMTPIQVKRFATIIKSFGYNMLQLYMEDTYEVENEPYFGYMRGRYTQDELKDIVEYCNGIGVEVIPCVQTLAHLNQIFRWGEYDCVCDIADILLVGNSRTYELIENMVKSLRAVFTSEYIHIGMDEAHLLGLGKYLQKHGAVNRFSILQEHLKKVIEIVEKYSFKPIMWSDMFFRLANNGEYYHKNPTLSNETIALTPNQVSLIFWDYYHDDKQMYDAMLSAHQKFDNEIWFAGGAWTWTGFAPDNQKTLATMLPAMQAIKEQNIENIFITMWGDNGKECSYYSVLPSLFAVKKFYDGETDMEKIKVEFFQKTGEDFDAMMALDWPNCVGGNKRCVGNVCKYMLYSDPFFGVMDTMVGRGVDKEYKKYAQILSEYAKTSKNYGYIFDCEAALCDVLSIKYDLGVRSRKAYQEKNREALQKIYTDYGLLGEKLEIFYQKFSLLWHKENKPHGFEVQDIRIGGLMQRLKACQKRLKGYLDGEYDELTELEETLISFTGNKKSAEAEFIYFNDWKTNASVNVI